MKRIISLFLTVTMIASLIIAIPVTNVAAAETITDEALFMTYPTYLSNSEMDEGLAKAEAAYYAVINSYSDSDETVAALMTSMSEGISILVKQGLANLGIGETLYETQAREAATKYMQSMLTNENVIKKASGMVDKAYKTLKTSYSIASNVDKTTMMADLVKVATENDISIKPDDIDDLVNDLYDAGSLKTDLAAIGEANKLWKIVFEFTEIHAIEKTTLDLLMDELSKSGQTGSDLYLGLSLLKKDMEKDSASYVLKYYATDKAVSYLADKADDLIGAVTSANAVSLVTTFMKVFADYIYVNAKAEDLTQAIMQTSFVSSIDICLSQYRLKFLQGTGTTEDIKTYENLYGAYLAAHKATLDTCYDIAKITDKFSLGGDCMIWSSNIETLYTYDKYIEWCKKEISHDISNNELDKTTGSSNITDALNEETIADRIERVLRLYPAGSKWAGDFGGTKSSLGYAGKVFNHIFDKTMSGKVENDYQYILTSNRNVRLIGRLEEKAVTEAALKELFTNVRIGDVVITSGQYDYLHAMTIVGMGETGPIVYDVDSKYGPAEEYTHLIQKYEFPYSKMADAFSSNGKYLTKPGISVYRAIKKVNTTNSGTSLYYEEYDDSVNYVIENGVLKGYKGSRTTIEIPDGVTSIAANCFKNNKSIKYVYMPDTITEIGNAAFYGCTNLRYIDLSNVLNKINSQTFYNCEMLSSIIIPSSVIQIDYEAFHNCSILKRVHIPDSVTYIGVQAFKYCRELESVNLPKGLTFLGGKAFEECIKLNNIQIPKSLVEGDYRSDGYGGAFCRCSSLKNVTFEEGTTVIPDFLFKGCTGLEEITIPDTVTKIGVEAFMNCTILKSVYISDNVTSIGRYAFRDCGELESVNLPKNLTFLGGKAFENCVKLNNIQIPKSLREGDYRDDGYGGAFCRCSSLKNVTFEEGTTVIPDFLFKGCTGLEEITIPDTVTKIGVEAFMNCTILKRIQISDNVASIGRKAFKYCGELESVNLPKSLTFLGGKSFEDCVKLNNIQIPKSLREGDYIDDGYGGAFCRCSSLKNVTFEEGTTVIPDFLFKGCTGLEEITIPDTITQIGREAFKNCTSLVTAVAPSTIDKIPEELFEGCSALKEFVIPESIVSMGQSVFSGCTSLERVTFLNSYNTLPSNTFYNCANLNEVNLPKNLTIIDGSAFYKCANIEKIVLPETLEKIKGSAFWGCSKLNNLNLPLNLKIIEDSSFYENKSLTKISIPENVTSIGSSAFQNCDALTKAEIKGSGSIGSKAFYDCDLLESITIGDKITSLGTNMCYDCDNLTDIKFGKGITTIPDSAFRLCQSLETVTIPRFCTTIAANAFAENTKLKSAYIPASVTSIQSNSFSYPNIMSIYGKNDSYANEYAEERGFTFVSVDVPITTLAYPESSMNIGYRATVTPDMQIMPEFDTDTITFTSGDANIATVSASGAVYGKSYGTTTITMTTESGLSDSIEVTVVRPATSVTLNKEGLELAAGNSEVLTATISPTNSTDVIKWSSDNTAVAVVDEAGKITAISKGTANITATAIYGNKSDTCLVTVVESNVPIVNVTGITLNSNEQEITIGKTYTLKANVLPADATNKLVEWTTSNSSVADVADGVVTAKSLGEATITAKTVSGGFVATCKVTVVPKVEITAFTAANYGANAFINLSVVNAPADAVVYVASYDSQGKLLELQTPVLSNGAASAIFQTANVFNYKAFIWKGDTIRPISDPKECKLQ